MTAAHALPGPADPDVSVVIVSMGTAHVEATLQSVQDAAAEAAVVLDLILVWQAPTPPPAFPQNPRVVVCLPAGASHARNRGLEVARAPLVAFVDEDEVVAPEWIAGMLRAVRAAPLAAAFFGAVEPLDDRGYGYCRQEGSETRIFRGRRTAPWMVGTGGNMAFRRDQLFGHGGFCQVFGPGAEAMAADDTELISRLLKEGETVVWAPGMTVYHPSKTEQERLESRFPYAYGMGRVLRRHRLGVVAAKYLVQLALLAATSVVRGDRRRLRELERQVRGFAAGAVRRPRWLSPERLSFAPPEVLEAIAGMAIDPLPAPDRPRPHFLYTVGEELVLHVYGHPAPGLERSLRDREIIRVKTGLTGIPRTRVLARGMDSLWLLEERLSGTRPRAGALRGWFDAAGEWAVALAAPGGRPLGEIPNWSRSVAEIVGAAPAPHREPIRRAFGSVAHVPSVPVHGDFSRKNLLLRADDVGVIDWEDASVHGMPGRDLLFLAVGAESDEPNEKVILDLAAGTGEEIGGLAHFLRRAGVPQELLPAILLAVCAGWAADEDRRLTELGAFQTPRVYRRLLERCASVLGSSPAKRG